MRSLVYTEVQKPTSGDLVRELLEARITLLRLELAANEAALRQHLGQLPAAPITNQAATPAVSDWIGAREAAKLLGVCHKTITVYQQRGIVPGIRIGGLYKFSRADVEAVLKRK